ncbi:MAG TPA: hypothetical protein VMD59_16230, partial [Acidimicrobiales bacterium]|nr:hypothetical protein [Acidimicrobiales bacterium]
GGRVLTALTVAAGTTTLIVGATSLAAAASSPTVSFGSSGPTSYSIGAAALDGVLDGPWTTSQPDTADAQTQQPTSDLFPYTPTISYNSQLTNMAAYPAGSAGPSPFVGVSGQAGTPGPVDGYCSSGGPAPESGSIVPEPTGVDEPFSPYYFPFVVRNADGSLTGYFDYRPKDTDEALVSATSTDGGKTWTVNGEALEQNRGYCADGDGNDNGQGHAFVMDVGGTSYLYTLNRVAGDSPGVGLLVHTLTGGESNPLAGLPASQPVGVDPDAFSTNSTPLALAATGGTAVDIPVSTLGTANTPTQLFAGQFVDLTTLSPGSPDVITCSSLGTGALDGCTAASAESIGAGDTIEQVVATVEASPSVAVPAGPNNAADTGGVTVTISLPSSTIATLEEANLGAGRVYVDGNPLYCVGDTVNATSIQLTNCTSPSGFSASNGDPVTLDPIVPASTEMTTGLTAPDGIVGTIPSYPGAPAGSTIVVYGEKILDYYAPTTTTASFKLPASGTVSIPIASTAFLPGGIDAAYYGQLSGFTSSGGTPVTFTVGDTGSSGGFASLSCTGWSSTDLTGCSLVSGTAGDSIASGSDVAIPGAALVPGSVLGLTGEGSSKPKTLYKNNEDYTVLQAAYTTDGVDFSTAGLAGGGLISGSDAANDVNNPAATLSPSSTAAYDNPVGSSEPDELRYVGSRGSIIENSDGSETMFLSGAWATDGDSDAFNQIFVTTSTDGEHWSTPVTLVSTDYSFSARADQDAAQQSGTDDPLDVSGYYSGRAYSPAAVIDPSTGVITLVFSGYSSPKPLPAVGSSIGTGSTQWTVSPSDPALYRDILTLDLTPVPPVSTPEAPYAVLLPLAALSMAGGAILVRRRRQGAASLA